MGIAKGWSIAGLVILLAASFLQAVAQTSVTAQPTTSGNATVGPLLIHVINMDPNMLPVTAAPTPTGGVVPPRHCRPYWATSISWNMNSMLMAVGMASGKGNSGCPFSGPVQIFNMSDPARPRLLHTLNDSKDWVRTVAFNHDGTWLAVGGDDKKVRLYDPMNPSTPLATLSDATGLIMSIDFNRDDTWHAVGSSDDRVKIYDVLNLPGVMYNITDATKAIRSVAYNHDGTLLAVGAEDEKVRIYRVGIRVSATTSSSARLLTSKLTTASSFARLSTSKLATTSTTISRAPSVNSTLIRHSSSYTSLPDNTEAPSLSGSCPPPEGIPLFQAYDAKNEQIYVVIQPESHSKKVNLARYKGSELDKQFGLCGIVTYTTSDSRLKMLASYQSLTGQVIHDTTGSQLVIVATATSGETVLVEFPLVAIQGGRAGLSVHNNIFPGGVQINDTAHYQGVMYFTGTTNNKLLFSSYHQQRLRFPKKYYKNDEETGLRIRVSPDGEKLYVTGISSDKNVSYPFFIRQYEKKELNPAASFGDNGKGILIATDMGIDNILQDILIQKNHVYVAVFNPESEKLSIRRFATDNGQMDSAFILDDTIRFSSGTSGTFLTVRLVTAKNYLYTIIYNSNGQLSVVTYENQANVHQFDTAFKTPATRSMSPLFVGNKAYLAVANADTEKGIRHVRMQVISLNLEYLPPISHPEFPDWGIGLITAGVVVLIAVVSAIVAVKKFKRKPPVPVSDATNAYQGL